MSDFNEQEIEVEAEEVLISQEPIELYKILKLANLVDGGGQAKYLIAEGYVAVNGELEHRKRRKTYDGDVVQVGEQFFVVMLADEETIAAANTVEPESVDAHYELEELESTAETIDSTVEVEEQVEEAADAPQKARAKGRKSIDFF